MKSVSRTIEFRLAEVPLHGHSLVVHLSPGGHWSRLLHAPVTVALQWGLHVASGHQRLAWQRECEVSQVLLLLGRHVPGAVLQVSGLSSGWEVHLWWVVLHVVHPVLLLYQR